MNAAPAAKSPPAWALVFAFGVIYIAWGTTYYAIKLGVREERLPPLLFGGIRILIAGGLLMVYQWIRGAPLRVPWRDALGLIGIGWLMFVAGNGLITYAQKSVDSSVAAVLIATTPLWIGLLATLWPEGERLNLRGWLGLFVGLGGVIVLLIPKLLPTLRAFDGADHVSSIGSAGSSALTSLQPSFDAIGFLFVLGSAASWALGSILLKRLRVRQPHLTTAAHQMLFGGVSMLAVGALLGEIAELPDQFTGGAVAVFFYLLIVGSLGGFVAFNWLLGHVSAAKVGTYAYVNPLVAVLIGWGFGEEVSWGLAAGMAVILLGVFLVRGGERPVEHGRPRFQAKAS